MEMAVSTQVRNNASLQPVANKLRTVLSRFVDGMIRGTRGSVQGATYGMNRACCGITSGS